MKKLLISAILVCGVMILIYGLPVGAKWIDITPLLGGEEGDTFDLKSTLKVNSLKVGSPDIGGVTYLRGSIVNDTSTGSQDNPVTFGDNVRIDGSIYRGDTMGPGVGHPVYINDDARIFGDLTVNRTAKIAGDQSVGGNSTITGNLAVNGSNGLTMGSDTNLYRNSADVLRTSDSLVVDGNVGIGTVDPQNTLEVAGEVLAEQFIASKSGGTYSGMFIARSLNPEPSYLSLEHDSDGLSAVQYGVVQAGEFSVFAPGWGLGFLLA